MPFCSSRLSPISLIDPGFTRFEVNFGTKQIIIYRKPEWSALFFLSIHWVHHILDTYYIPGKMLRF